MGEGSWKEEDGRGWKLSKENDTILGEQSGGHSRLSDARRMGETETALKAIGSRKYMWFHSEQH